MEVTSSETCENIVVLLYIDNKLNYVKYSVIHLFPENWHKLLEEYIARVLH